MTSIHALIPAALRAPVGAAKRRGEDSGPIPTGSKLLNNRKRPHLAIEPTPPALPDVDSDGDDFDDEASASKENDPSISPSPVNAPAPAARRPTLQKRPLSDLPTPVESPTDDEDDAFVGMTPSERNVAANTPNLSSNIACMSVSDGSDRPIKLAERSRSFNFAWRGKDDAGASGLMITPFEDRSSQSSMVELDVDMEQPAKKRVCSSEEFEEKENITEARPVLPTAPSKPLSVGAGPAKVSTGLDFRKVSSASGSSGSGSVRAAKPRIGLRRL
jgi:ubiquitin-conjugating enzyme E2 S